jgi:hypothetical protein
MGELIELIFRLIVAAVEKSQKPSPPAVDPAWVAQQAEWERQRRAWEEQQRRQQAVPPVPAAAAVPSLARTATGAVPARGRAARRVPPPVPPLPRPVPIESMLVEVTPDRASGASKGGVPTKASRPAASASQIARWAKPGTLRSQFILTEILKPPLSMRVPR